MVTVLCGGLAEAADWAERLGASNASPHADPTGPGAEHRAALRRHARAVSGGGVCGAVWAPVAHEDHARRAVLAAMELRQHLQEEAAFSAQTRGKRVILRLGLHTGSLVVGTLPYPAAALHGHGGDNHLAAALQQLAHPDAILLSATTHSRCKRRYMACQQACSTAPDRQPLPRLHSAGCAAEARRGAREETSTSDALCGA